jgi:hypothetical protein
VVVMVVSVLLLVLLLLVTMNKPCLTCSRLGHQAQRLRVVVQL